jgi:hypothetical protein
MRDPRRLTTLWTFTACYRDSFTFFTFINIWEGNMEINLKGTWREDCDTVQWLAVLNTAMNLADLGFSGWWRFIFWSSATWHHLVRLVPMLQRNTLLVSSAMHHLVSPEYSIIDLCDNLLCYHPVVSYSSVNRTVYTAIIFTNKIDTGVSTFVYWAKVFATCTTSTGSSSG